MDKCKTIIIGAGISGLACANKLAEKGEDFRIFYKELGGRMLTSPSHMVNYGASYITDDYKNVGEYVKKGEKIGIKNCYFLFKNQYKTLYNFRSLFEIRKIWKLYWLVRDFRKRLMILRKKAKLQSQQELIRKDQILNKYLHQSAADFVKENNLEYLNETVFNPLFYSTGFMNYDQSNAFYYLAILQPMFCPTYIADFTDTIKLLTKNITDKLIQSTVLAVQKEKTSHYKVITTQGVYFAENVVLALPYSDASTIYKKAPRPMHNNSIHVLHVVGQRKHPYDHKWVVFLNPDKHEITILWRQKSGGDIIFSKVANPNLEKYYESSEVIGKKYWETATVLSCSCWTPQILDHGLYLASDYNICGLEDAFITGIYAANQIIMSKADQVDRKIPLRTTCDNTECRCCHNKKIDEP